jgi:hypothetical protein
MIIDLIEVLNKEEDPDPKEIILDPDLRGPKCNGSFGSGTLHITQPHRTYAPTYAVIDIHTFINVYLLFAIVSV